MKFKKLLTIILFMGVTLNILACSGGSENDGSSSNIKKTDSSSSIVLNSSISSKENSSNEISSLTSSSVASASNSSNNSNNIVIDKGYLASVGTWHTVDYNDHTFLEQGTLRFISDGTCIMENGDGIEYGNFAIDGNKVTIQIHTTESKSGNYEKEKRDVHIELLYNEDNKSLSVEYEKTPDAERVKPYAFVLKENFSSIFKNSKTQYLNDFDNNPISYLTFVGIWQTADYNKHSELEQGTLKFIDDGTCIMENGDGVQYGNYTIDGDKVIIQINRIVSISGNDEKRETNTYLELLLNKEDGSLSCEYIKTPDYEKSKSFAFVPKEI